MLFAMPCGKSRRKRRAVAATEMALCLPLVAMLILASIEACGMIFLSHSLSIASYEGVRVAINFDSTNTKVMDKCSEMINARNLNGGQIDLDPDNISAVARGTPITVTVSAPCDANALIPPWFFGGKTLSASTTMVKE